MDIEGLNKMLVAWKREKVLIDRRNGIRKKKYRGKTLRSALKDGEFQYDWTSESPGRWNRGKLEKMVQGQIMEGLKCYQRRLFFFLTGNCLVAEKQTSAC